MRELTATEASRRFSELLDTVEHDGEGYVITRRGRRIARIVPVAEPNGEALSQYLRAHPPDEAWAAELTELRSLLMLEVASWSD
jgi:prevent-host-death family protein